MHCTVANRLTEQELLYFKWKTHVMLGGDARLLSMTCLFVTLDRVGNLLAVVDGIAYSSDVECREDQLPNLDETLPLFQMLKEHEVHCSSHPS